MEDRELFSRRSLEQPRDGLRIGRFRIGEGSVHDLSERRDVVRSSFRWFHNMVNFPATAHQRIGNQRPMAAPRDRFRAHDGCRLFRAIRHKLFNGSLEFVRLHIVGVSAKTGVAPSVVDRILPSLSKTPKRGHVEIAETGFLQALSQRVRIELRIVL